MLRVLHTSVVSQASSGDVVTFGTMLRVFTEIVRTTDLQLLPAISETGSGSMERLYPIRLIEALIFQESSGTVVDAASFKMALEGSLNRSHWGDNMLGVIGAAAFSKETRKAWDRFLIGLGSRDSNGVVRSALKTLIQGNLLPVWINGPFRYAAIRDGRETDSARFADRIVHDLEKKVLSEVDTFKWVEEKRASLDAVAPQPGCWNRRSTANATIAALTREVQWTFSNLNKKFQRANSFGKIVLQGLIRHYTTLMDTTIKSVTGDPHLLIADKVRITRKLLDVYFQMVKEGMNLDWNHFREWKNVSVGLQKGMGFSESPGEYESSSEFNGYSLDQAEVKYKDSPESLFIARECFDVRPFVVGANYTLDYGIHWPRTFEEHFTCYHQNLEFICQKISSESELDEGALASQAKGLAASVCAGMGLEISTIQRNDDGTVATLIRIPMRDHSAELTLTYHPGHLESGVKLEIHAFGGDEHQRWDQLACVGTLLGTCYDDVRLADPPRMRFDPSGNVHVVRFALQIAEDFQYEGELIDSLHWALQIMTVSHDMNTAKIIDGLGQRGCNIVYSDFPRESFRHLLYMIPAIMLDLRSMGRADLAARAGAQALVGLAWRGMTDYTRVLPSLTEAVLVNLKALLQVDARARSEIEQALEDGAVRADDLRRMLAES
jgi:hypothetical protein